MQKQSMTKIIVMLSLAASAVLVFADPPKKASSPTEILNNQSMNTEERMKSLAGAISDITREANETVLGVLGRAMMANIETNERMLIIENSRKALIIINQKLSEVGTALRSKYSNSEAYPDELDFLFRAATSPELIAKNPELAFLKEAILKHQDFISRSTDTYMQVRKMRSP